MYILFILKISSKMHIVEWAIGVLHPQINVQIIT
jgi:hypothetical protein